MDIYDFEPSQDESQTDDAETKIIEKNSKKRKFNEMSNNASEIKLHHDYNKFHSTAVEKKISSPMKKRLLTDQI